MHHGTRQLVGRRLLFDGEAENIKSLLSLKKIKQVKLQVKLLNDDVHVPHVCRHQLVGVVDARDADFSLTDEGVVEGVGGDEEQICRKGNLLETLSLKMLNEAHGSRCTNELRLLVAGELIEDVITSLGRQLERHSGLLQQVLHEINTKVETFCCKAASYNLQCLAV